MHKQIETILGTQASFPTELICNTLTIIILLRIKLLKQLSLLI